jgi:hypothetical protein
MNKATVESAALWDALFLAVQKLTEVGEIGWRPEAGGLRAGIILYCDEKDNDRHEEVGVISVDVFTGEGDVDAYPFTTEAATTLHKSLRDKYGYSEEESLNEVIAKTEEPTTLPTWATQIVN